MASLTVLSSVLVVMFSPLSEACTCVSAHPQTHFCNSDYVVVATAGQRIEDKETYTARYNLTVHKFLKKPENISDLIPLPDENGEVTVTVETPLFDSLCGVSLNNGTKYILGGSVTSDVFTTHLCGLRLLFTEVPKRLMNALSHKFAMHCDCQVKYCNKYNRKECEAESSNLCQQDCLIYPTECSDKFSMCRRWKDGKCRWTDNKYNKLCVQSEFRKRRRI